MGSLGYDPAQVIGMIMRVMTEQTGVQMEEAMSQEAMAPGRWRRVAADDPTADPSRVRLYMRTAADGEKVQTLLQERAVQVGSDLVTLRFTEVAAPRRQGNRRGGGRRGSAPPPERS